MDQFTRLAALSSLLMSAASLEAQTRLIYVDAHATAGGDGTSWNRAFNQLSDACQVVNRLGNTEEVIEVRIAQGVYRAKPSQVGDSVVFRFGTPYWEVTGAPSITSSLALSLRGGFGGLTASDPNRQDFSEYVSVLTADVNGDDAPGFVNRDDNAQTVLSVSIGSKYHQIVVEGLTIEGGNVRPIVGREDQRPGGMFFGDWSSYLYNMEPQIRQCRFIENSGIMGGGLAAFAERIADCEFVGNRAIEDGGGLYNVYGAVENCLFVNNAAQNGGAATSFADFHRCRFTSNSAIHAGGAVYGDGGGSGFTPWYITCLFEGNHAGTIGGAVAPSYVVGSQSFVHCTMVGNSAKWGGAVHSNNSTVRNSILFGNTATVAGNQISQSQGSCEIQDSDIEGGLRDIYEVFGGAVRANNVIDVDPRFVDQESGNYRLDAGSPCIDRADGTIYDTLDLDRLSRSEPGPGASASTPDLGCYEWRQTCPADFDNSGGTPDMTDLAAFFEAFSAGDAAADVNKSGGTPDSDDIEAFFNVWLAGGC